MSNTAYTLLLSLFLAYCIANRISQRRKLHALRTWERGQQIAESAASRLVEERWRQGAVQEQGCLLPSDHEALRILLDIGKQCEVAAITMEAAPR